MHYYPEHYAGDLTVGLKQTLAYFRQQRNFDAASYVEAKAGLLNDYMRKSGLKSCVIAVSGGLDSAAVLAIVKHASEQANSPIEKIVPVCLPVFTEHASSNQDKATNRGEEVAKALGVQPFTIDLTESHQTIRKAVNDALGLEGSDWASGQLVATTRTPAYYYVTSLMSDLNLPAIVVGTTNRDEGSYLGYVGKASDAMVDVQLITDLHKSEVYRVAAHLNVPASVLKVAPTGDMYDGRTDRDVFGASYDAAELYFNMLCADEAKRKALMTAWDDNDKKTYTELTGNLEDLHGYNAHKYLSDLQGVHLNILPTAVPGGWQFGPVEPQFTKTKKIRGMHGMFNIPPSFRRMVAKNANAQTVKHLIQEVGNPNNDLDSAFKLDGLLTADETAALKDVLAQQEWFAVGISGFEDDYKPGDTVGSWRLRAYDPRLAELLWDRLKHQMEPVIYVPEGTSQDAKAAVAWRAIGINPLLRVIKYEDAGSLETHYDAPANLGDNLTTLKTIVLYLTDGAEKDGGLTRFVRDPQTGISEMQKQYKDWPRCANDDEVIAAVVPQAGSALLFPHRLLHDGSPFHSAEAARSKIIIRTDVMYQAITTPAVKRHPAP